MREHFKNTCIFVVFNNEKYIQYILKQYLLPNNDEANTMCVHIYHHK